MIQFFATKHGAGRVQLSRSAEIPGRGTGAWTELREPGHCGVENFTMPGRTP